MSRSSEQGVAGGIRTIRRLNERYLELRAKKVLGSCKTCLPSGQGIHRW
jgi:hypothetical protein